MSRARQLFFWVLLAALLFAAHLSWQETRYGRGPQDASGDVSGPSREIAFVSNVVEGTVSLVDLDTYQILDTLDVVPDGKRVGLFRDPLQWLAQSNKKDVGLRAVDRADQVIRLLRSLQIAVMDPTDLQCWAELEHVGRSPLRVAWTGPEEEESQPIALH